MYDKIRVMAEEKHMTIKALEEKAGLSNGTISKYDKASPTLKTIVAIANALEIQPSTLVKKLI